MEASVPFASLPLPSASGTQRGTSDHLAEEGLTASEHYKKDAVTFGASWPLLCCALASKRLSTSSLLSLRASTSHSCLYSLDLRFSDPDILHTPSRAAYIARCSSSLSSLRLELQSKAFFFMKKQEAKHWTLGFISSCSQLQKFSLGWGMWVLNKQCAGASWLKSIHKLTLESVDFKNVNFHFLQSITPQLHEFTLHEEKELSLGPRLASRTLAFSFPNARLLRFRFPCKELKLTLTVSPTLKTLSVMAKWLVLSCKSTAPLALHHLSLYGQERLVNCSLCLAFVRVAYVDRLRGLILDRLAFHYCADCGGAYSATVDAYNKGECRVEEAEEPWDYDSAGEWYEQARARYRVHLESMHRLQLKQNMFAKPPSIGAPNLQFLFFPSSKACDTPTLAALQQDYPALALYCVVDRSFYWHRKGEHVSNGPLEIVRREKSGVLWDDDVGKKRAKNVREKMHSVNKKLVEGYTIDEDELYMSQISHSSMLPHPTHLQSQESQPISLVYGDQNPHWMRTVRYFLVRPGLHSLHLRCSDSKKLPTLGTYIARCSHSLSSLRLEIQGDVGSSKGQESECWRLEFLKDCAQLQELNLGRGMWKLNWQCVNTSWFKSIRKLTLEHIHYGSMSFQFLEIITPQLHEFTLYEDGNVLREHPRVPFTTTLAFSFPNARLLRFRFASTELHLTLTVPPSLETLSVVAKRLVLSCKSSAPLALHHLSLYGQEQLVVSSLRLASTRVAYLDGPTSDQGVFSWTELLGTIAPTVEVLIVRHGVPIKKVEAEWGRLQSLGIVVPPWDKSARVNNWGMGMVSDDDEGEEHLDDGRLRFSWADEPGYFGSEPDEEVDEDDYMFDDADEDEDDDDDDGDDDEAEDDDDEDDDDDDGVGDFGCYDDDRLFWAMYGPEITAKIKDQERLMKAFPKPPSIRAPNLRFLFFPTRKACNAPALAALRQDYPALALYCVVDRSFYWERRGKTVSNGPVEHVRREKSGVWDEEVWEMRAKKVREKMHSVNRRLVEGYCAGEDQVHVLQCQ
ncbi:unnamed protein product [Closterium sp. Naga37s-1]|nr:unnamed protein product [Closterium sp. Naga37s-1]